MQCLHPRLHFARELTVSIMSSCMRWSYPAISMRGVENTSQTNFMNTLWTHFIEWSFIYREHLLTPVSKHIVGVNPFNSISRDIHKASHRSLHDGHRLS